MFRRLLALFLLLFVFGLFAIPTTYACGPGGAVVPSSTTACYTGASTYVAPVATIYAYPLAVLALPTVAVTAAPAIAAPPPVPSSAPRLPAPAPDVGPDVSSVTPTSTYVQARVLQTYAAPLFLNSVAYGYGHASATLRIGHGLSINRTVVVRAQRQRTGFFQRLRERRAVRATGRGAGRGPARAVVVIR